MKLFKIIKAIPKAIRAAFIFRDVLELQVAGKHHEAFALLEKHKGFLEGKMIRYHLFRARILFNTYYDYENAIKDLSQGIILIESLKRLKPDTRQYLLNWSKNAISYCSLKMGKNDEAGRWKKECQEHHFDIDKIPEKIKCLYPQWDE